MGVKYEKVDLGTICGGAAAEVFQKCLADVMHNINDVNTDPEKPRRIALGFTFKPTQDRAMAEISFSCQAKVMPIRTVKGSMLMAREASGLVAYASTAKQEPLFDGEQTIEKTATA